MNTGAFGENFPYSNFHDLNMDWIIRIAKDFLDQYTHIQDTITNGEQGITETTEAGIQQINDRASQELARIINAFMTSANNTTNACIDSIPQDYTALSENVDDINTVVSLTKNLFRVEPQSANGITLTRNPDGSYHAEGTATGAVLFYADFNNLSSGDYSMSVKYGANSTLNGTLLLYARDSAPGTGTPPISISQTTLASTSRTANFLPIRTDIGFTAGTTVSADIYVQFEKSSFVTEYVAPFSAIDYEARKRLFDFVTPEMFGAVGDGVTDDYVAFRNMFNTVPDYGTVIIPPKKYFISTPITVNKVCLKISSPFNRDEYQPTIMSNSSTARNLFTFTRGGITVKGICFKNTSKNGTFLFFDADNETQDGNIDTIVDNCCFLYADTAVRGRGRNLCVKDCLISNITAGVRFMQTTRDTDNRGHVVTGNRIHYCDIGVQSGVNNNRQLHNIVITNNFCDGTGTLYTGFSSGVDIMNNIIHQAGRTITTSGRSCIIVSPDDGGLMANIMNNSLHGDGLYANRGIECHANCKVNIANNFIENCAAFGIVAQGIGSIVNNCIYNSGTYAIAYGATCNFKTIGNFLEGNAASYAIPETATVVSRYNFPD